jgi:hypothetical protein
MSEERSRRVGHNEALFRQVNERIEDLNDAFGSITGEFVIVCECGRLECTDQIGVARAVYERTREDPSRFILKPGHELPDVEHVVDGDANGDGDYVIIEKDAPEARRFAERTDPRT